MKNNKIDKTMWIIVIFYYFLCFFGGGGGGLLTLSRQVTHYCVTEELNVHRSDEELLQEMFYRCSK